MHVPFVNVCTFIHTSEKNKKTTANDAVGDLRFRNPLYSPLIGIICSKNKRGNFPF